jgi:hypothetical protein
MLQITQTQNIFRTELVRTHALRELSLPLVEGEFATLTGAS